MCENISVHRQSLNVVTEDRRDTRQWSDDYRTKTRTRTRITALTLACV